MQPVQYPLVPNASNQHPPTRGGVYVGPTMPYAGHQAPAVYPAAPYAMAPAPTLEQQQRLMGNPQPIVAPMALAGRGSYPPPPTALTAAQAARINQQRVGGAYAPVPAQNPHLLHPPVDPRLTQPHREQPGNRR
jgi:hypothetical protein